MRCDKASLHKNHTCAGRDGLGTSLDYFSARDSVTLASCGRVGSHRNDFECQHRILAIHQDGWPGSLRVHSGSAGGGLAPALGHRAPQRGSGQFISEMLSKTSSREEACFAISFSSLLLFSA